MKNIVLLIVAVLLHVACNKPTVKSAVETDKNSTIYPDYTNVVIPRNIAPINFVIKDTAEHYYVTISTNNNDVINIASKTSSIVIPLKKWSKLLSNKLNTILSIDIYSFNAGKWYHNNTISNKISSDSIDSYVVYRFINPANILWHTMGIYQRNIESFDVFPIMENSLTDQNCMHCHSFAANSSNNFMLHMRGKPGGTVIYSNGDLKFVDTKTEYTISAGGYPAWHPSGKFIAFSTNKIHQRFHAVKEKYAVVYDAKSDMILYNVENNKIQAIPELSTVDFENMPTWSFDGNYLYYLSSEYQNPDSINYSKILYDLKRISFDKSTSEFGEIETLISSKELGKSVAFPRVSPDNRYVAFCLADYGYFTVYNETSNIAILDLQTGELMYPDINSDKVESYPSWSSNGKWLMFNSKRDDGVCSRPYFSYFDDGQAHKPFVLPQETGNWNFEELNNINRPEFATSKLPLTPQQILKLVSDEPIPVSFDINSLTDSAIRNLKAVEEDMSSTFDFDQ